MSVCVCVFACMRAGAHAMAGGIVLTHCMHDSTPHTCTCTKEKHYACHKTHVGGSAQSLRRRDEDRRLERQDRPQIGAFGFCFVCCVVKIVAFLSDLQSEEG